MDSRNNRKCYIWYLEPNGGNICRSVAIDRCIEADGKVSIDLENEEVYQDILISINIGKDRGETKETPVFLGSYYKKGYLLDMLEVGDLVMEDRRLGVKEYNPSYPMVLDEVKLVSWQNGLGDKCEVEDNITRVWKLDANGEYRLFYKKREE